MATLDDSLGDFNNGAVLVEDGFIKAVGKAEDLATADAEIIDTTDGVVIPGMVDTHRHASMSLTRGLGADQSLFHFLANTYMRWLPATGAEDMHTSALVGALEAIDSGVTTILDTCETFHSSNHAEAELQGLKDSGIRAFFGYGMSDISYDDAPVGKLGWEARLAHVRALQDANSRDELVQVGLAISPLGAVPFDLTIEELKFAQERGMLCCSHTCAVVNSGVTKGLEELADHGLMLPGHLYIHCTSLSEREITLVAESGGKVSIAPETEMQMGMGIPPIRSCIEHGIKPSLSIDTSTSVAPDLFSQMRLALQLQRCLDNERAQRDRKVALDVHYTVRDALIWGTRNGAEALGLGDRIGTLTPGKRADITFISNKRALSSSAYPLGTAVLHSTAADVDTVMVDGVIRKRGGFLVGYDLDSIRAKAKAGLNRILDNLENMQPEMKPEEVRQYVLDAERSSRANLARAYIGESDRGDWMRKQ